MDRRRNVLDRRRGGLLAGCVAVGLAALGLVAGPSAGAGTATIRASAASHSGCWRNGPTVTDFVRVRWHTRYCHNYRGGRVRIYDWNVDRFRGVSGYLYAGNNWFVCQTRLYGHPNPRVGRARNNIWLYTQGDTERPKGDPRHRYHGWGWFPATYVSGGHDYAPIPGLPWCRTRSNR